MMDRKTLLTWLKASEIAGKRAFLRTLAADWLASWPDDREVILQLARMEVGEGRNETAAQRIRHAIELDPEDPEAYDLMADALQGSRDPAVVIYRALAGVLRGERMDSHDSAPTWMAALESALEALDARDGEAALQHLESVLVVELNEPLPTWLAVKANHIRGAEDAAMALAQSARARWPNGAPFRLFLGRYQLESGDLTEGVASLKRAAAHDPTGSIARKILGENHPFQGLWPRSLEAPIERPLPAELAAVLGMNRIAPPNDGPRQDERGQVEPDQYENHALSPAEADDQTGLPETGSDPAVDDWPKPEPWEAFRGPNPGTELEDPLGEGESEQVRRIQQELDEISTRLGKDTPRPELDSRVPAYVVLSSRTRLIQMFGEDRFHRIDEAILCLVEAVRRRPGWNAYRFYADDPAILAAFDLEPADPGNAWQVKHRLADLDRSLANRGEMIGALLIVGGHEIVPFHLLPNPTDDIDDSVPSDNPYAATDENYFAPEWPVGRLPFDDDCDQIVSLLRAARDRHEDARRPVSPLVRFRAWIVQRLSRILRGQVGSLGYSANIWRKASMDVFRTIGEPRALMTSPPINASWIHRVGVPAAHLSYFNLHGLEDAPEWFGQRDPLQDADVAEEFPVALRPSDVVNGGRAPRVVFTEACYGANVLGKSIDTALALKFLASGSQAVVGSTKISYGSVTPPLLAADLLGRLFWDNLKRNHPVGEALRRAKLGLAAEMHRRQGYLDGEDQKALISFLVYGDPLYNPTTMMPLRGRKTIQRRASRPKSMQTACALGPLTEASDDLADTERVKVQSIVARYLPGMKDASCRIHPQHPGCSGQDHLCPSMQVGIKGIENREAQTMVVTLSKSLEENQRHHPNFARLTLDPHGRVLKLTVSR